MRKNRILIVLFTGIVLLLAACTYDYFDDETNYQVFVPEILNRTVGNCRVMVYDESGELVSSRYAVAGDDDPRMGAGLFSFRLFPGKYKVYCYTDTDNVLFTEEEHLDRSSFSLKRLEGVEGRYMHPSDIRFQVLKPTIAHVGVLKTDTAELERYVGRITVRFKNFPADVSGIKKVELLAERAPVVQPLKTDTLTSRFNETDCMYHIGDLPPQETAGILEVDHHFMPSIEGDYMRLNYTFFDADGNKITDIPLETIDKLTGLPRRLLHGRRLIIEVDSYTVAKITLVGWDEDIASGDTDLE